MLRLFVSLALIITLAAMPAQARPDWPAADQAGSLQIIAPVFGGVFHAGGNVAFTVKLKPRVEGDLRFAWTVTDYHQQSVRTGDATVKTETKQEVKLPIDLGPLSNGYYELTVTAQATDAAGAAVASARRVSFGVAVLTHRSAAEARAGGYRFGMKMWGPAKTFDSYQAMELCAQLGLHWTRQLFTRDIDTLAQRPVNIMLKVEGFPASAYDAQRYGPIEQFQRRHHGWQKASLPLEQPYRQWLREVLATLPAEHDVFEIWNEPWGKFPPEDLAKLCQWAAQEIRKVKPDAIVGPNLGHLDFDAEFIKHDGMRGSNALFLHPYGHAERNELRADLRRIRAFYREKLGRDVDFYVTEYGSPTPPAGPRGNTTEQDQARSAVRSALAFYAEDVKAFMPHILGQSEKDPTNQQHWYGYFRLNQQPKPGLIALSNCARMIDASRYVGDLYYQPEVGAMLFERDGQHTLVLWTNDVEVPVEVDAAASTVTLVDIVGAARQVATADGKLALTLTGDPLYLVGVGASLAQQARTELRQDRFVLGRFVRGQRVAHRMQSPPNIDGRLTDQEWAGHTRIQLQARNMPQENISALGYVAWDARHLYIAADITDDHPGFNPFKAPTAYDGDSLELWVGSQPKYQIPEFVHSHDQQLLFAATSLEGQPVAGRVKVANYELSAIEGLRIAFGQTQTGWTVEMAIPLSHFPEFPGVAGHIACLEMRVNDRDPGPSAKRVKADPVDGSPSHHDATRWSYLELVE